jgi:hypothetical protein
MKYQVAVSFDNGTTEIFPACAGSHEKALQKTFSILEKRFNAKIIRHPNSNYSNARIVDFYGNVFHDITFDCWRINPQK